MTWYTLDLVAGLGLGAGIAAVVGWWASRLLRTQLNAELASVFERQLGALAAQAVSLRVPDLGVGSLEPEPSGRPLDQRASSDAIGCKVEWVMKECFDQIPLLVRHAVQVELTSQTGRFVDLTNALGRQLASQVEAHARQVAELQGLLDRLERSRLADVPRPAVVPDAPFVSDSRASPKSPTPPSPMPPTGARPPELGLMPLPRPAPALEDVASMPDLTDEQIDALPPDVPSTIGSRKRLPFAPKKPPFSNL